MKTLRQFFHLWKVQLLGFTMTIFIVGLYVYQPSWLRILDYRFYDNILAQGHTTATNGVVAIVDLDEESLRRYGQWPWPRYRLALLLRKLQQAGVLAVGMDMLFPEPDRSSPYVLQQELKKDLDVDIDFIGLPGDLMDNDRIFARTLSEGPFVLGFFMDFQQETSGKGCNTLKDINAAVIRADKSSPPPERFLTSAPAVLTPLEPFCNAAPAAGFINTIRDRDGVLRSTPMIMMHDGKIYGGLGFSTLWTAMGKPQCVLKMNANGVQSIRLGKMVVPLDSHGRFRIHYRGPQGTFPYISAADILDDRIDAGQLQNRIVLVGTSAAGLHDMQATPLDAEYPGVEVHATLIDNILSGDFITVPDWLPGMELFLTLTAGIMTSLLICWLSPWLILPMILFFIGMCWYASLWAFTGYRFYFSPLFPIIAAVTNFSLLSFTRFILSDRQKRFLRKAFSRYVASSIVDRIVASPESLRLEGEEKEVSILFSDIRGFTGLSERLTPPQIASLLQGYLTPMTRIIVDHLGTLDKFIGDAVMAFWNAPLDVRDHQRHAVTTGLAMLDELDSLNETFQEKYGLRLEIGIGLHAGKVSVGNMGSEHLFDYTIIGDNVNLASRLEGLTKHYGIPLLVSDALRDVRVEGYTVQQLDTVTVKGREKPVVLFTFRKNVLLIHDEIDLWKTFLTAYRKRDFSAALQVIGRLAGKQPGFSPYRIYTDRCESFLANPPPDGWNGVFSHSTK